MRVVNHGGRSFPGRGESVSRFVWVEMPRELGFSVWDEVFVQSKRERVDKVISDSRIFICDSVVAQLALGRTYCEMARLATHSVKSRHLFALACEALTMAEEYVALAPPKLLSSLLDDAERLRLELRQLNPWATQESE